MQVNKIIQPNAGFTLVELMLYVAIASSLLILTSTFLGTILESRIKNQTIAEVEQQAVQIMQLFSQTVRNAEAITAPAKGLSASSATLDVVAATNDPTIFDLSSGVIRIKEGAGSAVALHNSRVVATDLTFKNVSRTGTPGVLRIEFTLSHLNPEGRHEYSFGKTFYTSGALRHP